MVSHNLRAPVANILGLSELIKDDALDHDLKREVIRGISESVGKLDEVITDLNYILQKKQSSKKMEIIDLTALTLNISHSIEKLIQQENVLISYDFEAVPNLLSVKSYLYSIFYNLIHNSIKYRSLNTNSTLEIKSSVQNGEIILVFKDNGIGIDLARMGSKIFGMYKRFHPEISDGKGECL